MASFSIKSLATDTELMEAFSGISVKEPYKDYNKDLFTVKFSKKSGEESYLSLKLPILSVVTKPEKGSKYFYAKLGNLSDSGVVDAFDALDTFISSKMADKYVNKMQPTFKNIDSGLVKIYIPHKSGEIRHDRLKIYDSDKKQKDIFSVKEGSKIKLLAYLKHFKRYRDEIVPMWIAEQMQIISTEPELPENKDSSQKIPEPENEKEILENHLELGSDRKPVCDLSDESHDSNDASDDDYNAPW